MNGSHGGKFYIIDLTRSIREVWFWKHGDHGYTTDISKARLITLEELRGEFRNAAQDLRFIPAYEVESRAGMTVDRDHLPELLKAATK